MLRPCPLPANGSSNPAVDSIKRLRISLSDENALEPGDLCLQAHTPHAPRVVHRPRTAAGSCSVSCCLLVLRAGTFECCTSACLAASIHHFSTCEFCHVMQIRICAPSCSDYVRSLEQQQQPPLEGKGPPTRPNGASVAT